MKSIFQSVHEPNMPWRGMTAQPRSITLCFTRFCKSLAIRDSGRRCSRYQFEQIHGEGVTFCGKDAAARAGQSASLTSVAGVNVSFLRKLHEPTVEAIRIRLSGRPPDLGEAAVAPGDATRSLAMTTSHGPMGRKLAISARLH